jgi:hypothetical protein
MLRSYDHLQSEIYKSEINILEAPKPEDKR